MKSTMRPHPVLCRALMLVALMAGSTNIHAIDAVSALDDGMDLFDNQRYKNADDALQTLVNASSFRRLDSSQKMLAYSHIAYSKINRGLETQSLKFIDKALAQAKLEFGERSLAYVDHLETKAVALYWADKRRDALRVAGKMDKILERMGEAYDKERKQVLSMISTMHKSELEEGDLPYDFSEFYTACEQIQPDSSLTKAHAVMRQFSLVGTDFKPGYKQASYFKDTHLMKVRESSTDRRTRVIYIPGKEYIHDWCVLYRDGKNVKRSIISSSNDR